MKNKNMEIWDQVCISDPSITKPIPGAFKLTAIDAQSQIKRATEVFGPFGIGWGVEKESHNFGAERVYYTAVLWYKWDGQTGAVAICSDHKDGRDVMKCLQTDAITKGLSRIGFNSDIFEGTFDGNKYVKPQAPKRKKNGSMSDVAYEQEQQYDGSEGVDLEKEMVYDPNTKIKFGYIKDKSYNQATKKELQNNHDHFIKYDNIDDELRKHLNTVEAELSLRENNGVSGE